MKVKEIEAKYNADKQLRKDKIKLEPNKHKRFWKWVWYVISFPFIWIWVNLRDWRTLLIFGIVCAIVSSEVWVFYLMGFISWGTDFSKWCMGIASACWVWWLLPGTPFLPLCIAITIGIKALFNKWKHRGE